MSTAPTTVRFEIERTSDTDIQLRFVDADERKVCVALSNIEPGQDTSDTALLGVAASVIAPYASIAALVDAATDTD